jgi:hypothetical protein
MNIKKKGGKIMKFKLTVLLAACVVTMGLLLGTSAAQAATVFFDPSDPERAIGINNLDVGGTLYNVAFISQTTAQSLYGDVPGVFDFPDSASASAAVDAVNVELNAEGAYGRPLAGRSCEAGRRAFEVSLRVKPLSQYRIPERVQRRFQRSLEGCSSRRR